MENQTVAAIDASGRTIGALLRCSARRLSSAGIAAGARDAEVLLGHALGVTREQLVARAERLIDERQAAAFERLLLRRIAREPVAHITGAREFWSLNFWVTPDVLIPRPETELLVEIALDRASECAVERSTSIRIADIGTGSGALAVALATELPMAHVTATDISSRALDLAKSNAKRNRVAERIRFVQSDLFTNLATSERFDLIVSNPPYVRSGEIVALEPEVSRWEPWIALDGGPDGGDFYRRIALEARHYLSGDGALFLEIGDGMGAAVAQIFRNAGGWAVSAIRRDYAGRERAAILRRRAAFD